MGSRFARVVGVAAIIAAVACNKWFLQEALTADGSIASRTALAGIVLFQLACLGFGIWCLTAGARARLPRVVGAIAAIGLVVALSVGVYGGLRASYVIGPDREYREAWRLMIQSEELLLALTPDLGHLTEGLLNLELPSADNLPLFADTVQLVDLDEPGESEAPHALPAQIETLAWPHDDSPRAVNKTGLSMWEPLLARVAYFDNAKFYFISGQFADAGRDRFDAEIGFAALARLTEGQSASIKTVQHVVWRPGERMIDGEPIDGEPWQISEWTTKKAKVQTAGSPLFEEVLAHVLPADQAKVARHSIHEDWSLKYFSDERKSTDFPPFFDLMAFDRQPGVSVADVNGDGFSDIYLMARFGPNELFVNQGDGTFHEEAAAWGLDLDGHTSSAIFADFDNDGDPDAFLGRTLEPSRYLVNEGDRFVDRSEQVDVPLPHLASAVSAVDYNADGLLDVYVSTYAYRLGRKGRDAYGQFLPEDVADELERRLAGSESHQFLGFPGPPNVLLRNAGGGRFEHASDVPELALYWNTWQSTWSDYDGDGDQDVYVANDFAPNQLLRNEGDGRFVDVTAETGTADHGFGMGASWGDYDQDGDQDLYVTNMYSKAGRRITAQLPGLDPRMAKMARGNSLFRNDTDVFAHVSGVEPPALTVEAGGWGWSGQFVDVDNDTFLDVHSLSGFYTSATNALPVDT